jgi:hypothetical protein
LRQKILFDVKVKERENIKGRESVRYEKKGENLEVWRNV